MNVSILTRTLMAAGLLGVLGMGCGGTNTEAMGTAQILIVTPKAFPSDLTQVTVETDSGFSTDLQADADGNFLGSLTLPAGIHEFVGKAFIGTDQVGESNPVAAEIVVGAITNVMIQILDTTGGEQPDFGPILESLSHPESAIAGTEVMFAVSIIDVDGDPVAIQWSDDCDDATFTDPTAAITNWSKATPGSCRVDVVGTSNDKSVTASFQIVVFEPGANTGAANIVGEFVSAPRITISMTGGDFSCVVEPSADFGNASCPGSAASPNRFNLEVFTDEFPPGLVDVTDNCGGTFTRFTGPEDFFFGEWLPPVTGGICVLTAQATNTAGVTATLSAAVLVRDGEPPPPAQPPFIQAFVFNPDFGECPINSDQIAPEPCGIVQSDPNLGTPVNLSGFVDFRDGIPDPDIPITFSDDCGGTFDQPIAFPSDFFNGWFPPPIPGVVCNVTITATNTDGISGQTSVSFDVQ